MSFENQSVLITGGSRGLGLALARILAGQGARVVITGRDGAALERAAAGIRRSGGTVFAVAGDVADKHAIHPLAAQAAELAGPVDLLVNNASSLGPVPLGLLLDTECEEFARVLETNLLGPFRLAKAVAGSMLIRGRGTVLNVSSDAAASAYPNWGIYGASKAALDHLTRIWAAELAGTPVRFYSVDPGEMDTRMHADAVPDADPASLARPEDVAVKILDRLEKGGLPSGARFSATDPLAEAR